MKIDLEKLNPSMNTNGMASQITKGGIGGVYPPKFVPLCSTPPLKKSGLYSAPHPLASKTLVTFEWLLCE